MRSILQHFNIFIRFFVRSKSNWAVQQTLCKQSEISPSSTPLLMGTATPPAAAAPLHTWQNLRLSTAAAKYFAVHLMMRKVLCCNGDLDGACPIYPPPSLLALQYPPLPFPLCRVPALGTIRSSWKQFCTQVNCHRGHLQAHAAYAWESETERGEQESERGGETERVAVCVLIYLWNWKSINYGCPGKPNVLLLSWDSLQSQRRSTEGALESRTYLQREREKEREWVSERVCD